jgi:hypothetical protein
MGWNGIEFGLNNLPGGTPDAFATAQAIRVLARHSAWFGVLLV